MKITNQNYEIIQTTRLEDMSSDAMLLRHKKSGARVVLISNEDDNKTFYIGFRTPPQNSTGVAHILEHSVLCGSDKYPVKDPFVELAKGSLNTFLNAMTYPDRTVYPVASCNDKDFRNLVDVYMDAVLHPAIYSNEKIFRQEGWHYELESADDDLKINGVVYNEMKGAFSSPDDVLSREVLNTLFPDNAYGVESGGDPDVIPELSYEEFLEFHKTYYHPANSYIYLYGNMDMDEYLSYLDEEYLSNYEKIDINSEIADQADFTDSTLHIIEKEYPVMSDETEDATMLNFAAGIGSNLDPVLYEAFSVIDYALCAAPGAPLKKALLEKGICSDISSDFDRGLKQNYYSISASDANYEDKDAFIATIQDVLEEQIANGIDEKALLAAINLFEFRYREADFGSYPKGLIYGLKMMESWLYDDEKPFIHLCASKQFAYLREMVGTSFFVDLVRDKLLNSGRKAYVIMKPVVGLSKIREDELNAKLAKIKDSLTKEEIETIVASSKALKEYQNTPDSKENLAKLPVLSREDIGRKAKAYDVDVREEDGTKILFHKDETNGIGYLEILFDMTTLPERLYTYAGILKELLTGTDTLHYKYNDLNNEINLSTGGMSVGTRIDTDVKNPDELKLSMSFRVKVFYDMLPDAFELVKEVVINTCLDDTKRIKEILSEIKSDYQQVYVSGSLSAALSRVNSYHSKSNLFSERTDGYDFYLFIDELLKNYEDRIGEVVSLLKETINCIFRPENLMIGYTASESGYKLIPYLVAGLKQELFTAPCDKSGGELKAEKKNEAFVCASKVQYVATSARYLSDDMPYTGALRVAKNLLSYDYLWNNIRVKGGAYGCVLNFARTGYGMFASYRDPKLRETMEVFKGMPDYLRNTNFDEVDITKAIIGTISDMDTPTTPRIRGASAISYYLTGVTAEDLQSERDAVLDVTDADIKRTADYVQKIVDQNNICVVGSESEIEACNDMFMNIIRV